MEKIKLGLIYGGKSSEHEVSLRSTFSILQAIDYTRYEVIPFYIELDGNWIKGKSLSAPLQQVDELRLERTDVRFDLFRLKEELDVAFPVVHGPFGEDGTLQGFLELLDIPYVGCGVVASSTGMDKIIMKKLFATVGIPQCAFLHYTREAIEKDLETILNEIEEKIKFPCFIKPANLGSSVGISKATNKKELCHALYFAAKFDRRIIVEEFIEGREIEIGVLGNEELKTSVVGEIFSVGDFYDYSAKYKNIGTELQIPAEIPTEISEKVALYAKNAFNVLDGSGLSRIDFFYNEKTGNIYINEINTMPGFTEFSMYPMLFKEAGISYRELIETLISLGIERFNDKKRNQIAAGGF